MKLSRVAIATVALTSGHAFAQSIINLGVLSGDSSSSAVGISGDGSTIVGLSRTTGSSAFRAFRWTAGTGMQDLSTPVTGTNPNATGISGDGNTIIGGYQNNSASVRGAFRWTSTGGMQIFGTQGLQITADAVSNDGSTIAGKMKTGTNSYGGYVWTQAQGFVSTGAFESIKCSGDGSTVVGKTGDNLSPVAARWTSAGGVQTLTGMLPGSYISYASAVNADGSLIAGITMDNATGERQAFRWTAATGMLRVTAMAGATGVMDIYGMSSNASVMVGSCMMPGGSQSAFIWKESLGGMVSLSSYLASSGVNLTGWTLTTAMGVSADGTVITGTGRFNGADRAFVVVVPAPGAIALLGMAGIAARRRRRG
jgi:probable HAF family extracellular repeat protein